MMRYPRDHLSLQAREEVFGAMILAVWRDGGAEIVPYLRTSILVREMIYVDMILSVTEAEAWLARVDIDQLAPTSRDAQIAFVAACDSWLSAANLLVRGTGMSRELKARYDRITALLMRRSP